MTTKAKTTRRGRREFLKGLAVIGGTTVLVTVAKDAMSDADEEKPAGPAAEPAAESKGYHVTPHIQTYYEKAGF